MLDGLDSVNWAALGHAYGPADDVPGQLRALTSDEGDVRRKAIFDLYGNIFHQGTRYEATAYAVPFLVELLAHPETADRAEILGLLAAIAIGYDEQWLPHPLPIADYREQAAGGDVLFAQARIPSDEPLEEDEEEDEYGYLASLSDEDQNRAFAYAAVAAYDAVKAGVPLYRDLLSHPDNSLRTAAAYALAWFPEVATESVPVLLTTAATAPEPVAAAALAAAGLLDGEIPEALLDDPRPLVRWGAAIALVQTRRSAPSQAALADTGSQGDAAPQEAGTQTASLPDAAVQAAIAELRSWVAGPTTAEARIPFLNGDLAGYAALALVTLGPAEADSTFDAVLARFGSVTGAESLPIAAAALLLAFPGGPAQRGATFSDLEERQRHLAQRLAECPQAWLYNGSTFGNFSQMMSSDGLPSSHSLMRAFALPD